MIRLKYFFWILIISYLIILTEAHFSDGPPGLSQSKNNRNRQVKPIEDDDESESSADDSISEILNVLKSDLPSRRRCSSRRQRDTGRDIEFASFGNDKSEKRRNRGHKAPVSNERVPTKQSRSKSESRSPSGRQRSSRSESESRSLKPKKRSRSTSRSSSSESDSDSESESQQKHRRKSSHPTSSSDSIADSKLNLLMGLPKSERNRKINLKATTSSTAPVHRSSITKSEDSSNDSDSCAGSSSDLGSGSDSGSDSDSESSVSGASDIYNSEDFFDGGGLSSDDDSSYKLNDEQKLQAVNVIPKGETLINAVGNTQQEDSFVPNGFISGKKVVRVVANGSSPTRTDTTYREKNESHTLITSSSGKTNEQDQNRILFRNT